MMISKRLITTLSICLLALSVGSGLSPVSADDGFFSDLPLTNQCAVFNKQTTDPNITRIVYGEDINFRVRIQANAVVEDSTLKFQIMGHGDGVGISSGITYIFNGKAVVKANTSDINRFRGSFTLDARVIGKGNAASQGTIAQGAQDNAVLHYKVSIDYLAPTSLAVSALKTDFSIECSGSPWSNEMTGVNGTNKAIGRGFGDVWNKYAWSMKDFNGGMLVGTKNAYYDYAQLASPSTAVRYCYSAFTGLPSIYRMLACSEMFDTSGEDGSSSVSTKYAEIWRFDYAKKTWTNVHDDSQSQGFRVMATHGGKLYAGSDLGSFVAGVQLGSHTYSASAHRFNFPGTELLTTVDGRTWTKISSCTVSGPCNSLTAVPFGSDVNISIRALASYNDKLYVGTFNVAGAELWSWDGSTWSLVKKYGPAITGVTELRVMGNQLMVGLGGVVTTNYMEKMGTSDTSPTSVAGLPSASGTLGVLKLFVSSKGTLFVGLADVNNGFKLYSWSGGSAPFTTVTTSGFGNPENAYAWSMNEINGRVFIGTFNRDFFNELPRGSAELWYSDDGGQVWQQMALPLDWGMWNYGIRNLEVGKGQLFLGSASNMIAPDLTTNAGIPLSPGAEIWSIRTNVVAPKK